MNSIFKTFILSLMIIANTHLAYAQTASILPPAKTVFLDSNGNPLTAGTVTSYIPGTTTKKTTWQDAAETIPNQNPLTLDAAGRALLLGSGSYRQVVKDKLGNLIWDQVTSSTGSGGGSSTTATGDGDLVGTIKPWAGMTAPNQYAFTYGQEISRATYSVLFTAITSSQAAFCTSGSAVLTGLGDTTNFWIGSAVEISCVAGGFSTIVSKTATTVTMAANANVTVNTSAVFFPWGRGNGSTTFNLPDLRGQVLAGNNNMGGTASSNLTTAYFGATNPNSVGALGGSQSASITLLTSNLPPYTPAGSFPKPSGLMDVADSTGGTGAGLVRGTTVLTIDMAPRLNFAVQTFTGSPQGGTSAPIVTSIIQPTKTSNYIIKITPDSNSDTASGVTSIQGMTGDIACGAGLSCTGNNISVSSVIVNTDSVNYTPPFTSGVIENQTNYNKQRISVIDFGATGNGTTDDTAAIQAAINAGQAARGKTVYFPAPSSCYKITSPGLSITAQITLLGDHGTASKICATDTNAITLNFVTGFGDVTIDGLYLVGSGATAIRYGILNPGTTNVNDVIYGITIRNTLISTFPVGVSFRTVRNLLIENSWIQNVDKGVQFVGQVINPRIVNSTIVKAAGGGGIAGSVGLESDQFTYTTGGTVPPEGIKASASTFFGFDTCVLLSAANYIALDMIDTGACLIGVQFANIAVGLQITNGYFEIDGTTASVGIYGTGLGSPIPTQVNIADNTIIATGTVSANGIQINGSGNQNQNNVNIVRNYFLGMTNNDIRLNNPGDTNVENNRCESSAPTNSISIGTRTSGTITVSKNVCAKAISLATASDATNGFVRLENNTVSATTAQPSTWNVTTNSTTAGQVMIGGGAGVQPTGLTLGSGVSAFLATPSSSNLAAAVTGETGSGALVFGTSPTIATPIISVTTVSALPACASGTKSMRSFVTDNNTALAWSAVITSGGTIQTPVYCDGTVWRQG